jgi:hypothetical protein
MKTLHYYLVAFAVTGIFFALVLLVAGNQPAALAPVASGYNARPANNPNDQTDPAGKALAAQREKQKEANLAIADPQSDSQGDLQPK